MLFSDLRIMGVLWVLWVKAERKYKISSQKKSASLYMYSTALKLLKMYHLGLSKPIIWRYRTMNYDEMELSPQGLYVWERKQALSGRNEGRDALEIRLGALVAGGGSELY